MNLVTVVATILRRLRAERGTVAFVFVLVTVTSFLVAAAPRLLNHAEDEGLRHALTRGTALQRNIELSTVDTIPASAKGPFAAVEERGSRLRKSLPPTVDGLVGSTRFVIDTPRFALVDAARLPTFIAFRQAAQL